MSKVICHTHANGGKKVREHNHFPQGKSGYVPGSTPDTMTVADIKNSKR